MKHLSCTHGVPFTQPCEECSKDFRVSRLDVRIAALEADLAAMRNDRDYHREIAMQQSEYWRAHHETHVQALNAELAGYRRALKCANDYVAQRDPINGYAVFAVPFTPAEMAASQSETNCEHDWHYAGPCARVRLCGRCGAEETKGDA